MWIDKQMLEKVFCSNIVSSFKTACAKTIVFMNWSSEHPTPGSVMPLAICLLLLRWVVLEPLVCLATMAFGAYITQQGIYRQLEQSL